MKDKVFLCWGGEASHEIAKIICRYLDRLDIECFICDEIPPGKDAFSHIVKEINECKFQIICLTPQSIKHEWVWIEIGMFYALHDEYSYPFLFGIEQGNVDGIYRFLTAREFSKTAFFDVIKEIDSIIHPKSDSGKREKELELELKVLKDFDDLHKEIGVSLESQGETDVYASTPDVFGELDGIECNSVDILLDIYKSGIKGFDPSKVASNTMEILLYLSVNDYISSEDVEIDGFGSIQAYRLTEKSKNWITRNYQNLIRLNERKRK
jgi:hypothetical protein